MLIFYIPDSHSCVFILKWRYDRFHCLSRIDSFLFNSLCPWENSAVVLFDFFFRLFQLMRYATVNIVLKFWPGVWRKNNLSWNKQQQEDELCQFFSAEYYSNFKFLDNNMAPSSCLCHYFTSSRGWFSKHSSAVKCITGFQPNGTS